MPARRHFRFLPAAFSSVDSMRVCRKRHCPARHHARGGLVTKTGQNYIHVFWYASNESAADGALFTLRFQVKEFAAVGESAITVSYQAANTLNGREEPVAFSTADGAANILSALVVNVARRDAYTAEVSVQYTPARYVIAAFYRRDQRLVALNMQTLTDTNAVFTVQSTAGELLSAECKVFFLGADLRPICECKTF